MHNLITYTIRGKTAEKQFFLCNLSYRNFKVEILRHSVPQNDMLKSHSEYSEAE